MAFPRNKSRALRVHGQDYRWVVSRPNDKGAYWVRVAHATEEGQKVVINLVGSPVGAAVTPGRVRALVERALVVGWTPLKRGPELRLEPCPPRPARPWPQSVWFEEPAVRESVEGPLSLESWAALDSVQHGFPWEHHLRSYTRFRAWGGATDIQVGSLFADIAARRGAKPGGDREKVLRALLQREDDAPDGEFAYYLSGGRVLRRGERVLMEHGCCVSLDEWVEWRDLKDGAEVWNGHDPWASATREGEQVRFNGGWGTIVTLDAYARLVRGMEDDMRGFVRRCGEWLDKHAPASLRGPIFATLARTLHVPIG